MRLGVDYYPEQWPAERWATDAKMMRLAGLTLVRIGEFAWAQIEPKEGVYQWGWLDRAVETLAGEGLHLVLGTPTAAPPAWLCQFYPDVLPVDAQGHVRKIGSRRHYCPNSHSYRRFTESIVGALARRYGQHPAVIGWQMDNEFGCHDTGRCYCERCASAFRIWLQKRYTNLEALNQAWGTVFWSECYSSWEQIDPPNQTLTEPNPSHALDYARFASDSFLAYQQLQIDVLRLNIQPFQWITTNLMLSMLDLDYHALARPLSLVAWDSYPTGHKERDAAQFYLPGEAQPQLAYDVGDPLVTGFGHTLMRGLKQAPFWVMEQQCGQVNWGEFNPGLRPGTPRLWTWHAAACGAETVVYFRWRAGLQAQEQLHSGLLHHDGSPDLGYRELRLLDQERTELERFTDRTFQAKAALLWTYPDLWALRLQPHHSWFSLLRHLFVYYRAFQRLGIPVDIVSPEAELGGYKLLVAPTLFLGEEKIAHLLEGFAQSGGSLLLGVRSGFKTSSNLVSAQPLPGVFRGLLGAEVTDWHALPPGVSYPVQSEVPGLAGESQVWAEALKPLPPAAPWEGIAAVLASYTEEPFSGKAALVERLVGDGRALYLGWFPSVGQAQAILEYLAGKSGIERLGDIPDELVAIRRGDLVAVLNFSEEARELEVAGKQVRVPSRDLVVV